MVYRAKGNGVVRHCSCTCSYVWAVSQSCGLTVCSELLWISEKVPDKTWQHWTSLPEGHNAREAEEAVVVFWTEMIQTIEGIYYYYVHFTTCC